MTACPPLPVGDDAGLASVLASIDCRLGAAVSTGYGRLFGDTGAFTGALTAVMTLYVALLAFGLITGRARLTLSGAAPRVFALGLVLAMATAWPAYQTVVFDLLSRGPDQIASAFVGNGGSATLAFAQRLDGVFGRYLDLAQTLQAQGQQASPNLQMAAKLAWGGSLLLILSTAGLLVMARVVLAVLLALGPVFVVFALFSGTRGLFEGWLKTVVAFALLPLLIVLGGAGALAMMAPLLDEVTRDPLAAGDALRPVAMLFLASVIYVGVLLALLWAAASLTRHWRLSRVAAVRPACAHTSAPPAADPARAIPSPSVSTRASHAGMGGGTDETDRVSMLFAALSRTAGGPSVARETPATILAQARDAAPRDRIDGRGLKHLQWHRSGAGARAHAGGGRTDGPRGRHP